MKILKVIGIFIFGSLAFAGITQRNALGGENNIYFGFICLIFTLLLLFSFVRPKTKDSAKSNNSIQKQNVKLNGKIIAVLILLIFNIGFICNFPSYNLANKLFSLFCFGVTIFLILQIIRVSNNNLKKKEETSNKTENYLPPQNTSTDLNVNTTDNITPNMHNISSEHLHTAGNNFFLNLPKDVISLLYIKGGTLSNYKESLKMEPSLIDLSLPIDTTDILQEDAEEDIGYYPSYAGLSPKQRYIYLKWLQNIDDPIPIGYVFIFYYGLERQLLHGKYNQAFRMIIRLQKHHKNGSFISYSTDALLISSLKHKKYDMIQEINTNESSGKICILINFINEKPITAEHLISIRNSIGFTNNRYLKLCPELFIDILNQKLVEHYNSHFYPVTKEDFTNSTNTCTLALANYSLASQKRFVEAPDITSNSSFSESVYKLLSETHEEVKRLRRKQKAN